VSLVSPKGAGNASPFFVRTRGGGVPPPGGAPPCGLNFVKIPDVLHEAIARGKATYSALTGFATILDFEGASPLRSQAYAIRGVVAARCGASCPDTANNVFAQLEDLDLIEERSKSKVPVPDPDLPKNRTGYRIKIRDDDPDRGFVMVPRRMLREVWIRDEFGRELTPTLMSRHVQLYTRMVWMASLAGDLANLVASVEHIGYETGWKRSTILELLKKLIDRGYIARERLGRSACRYAFPDQVEARKEGAGGSEKAGTGDAPMACERPAFSEVQEFLSKPDSWEAEEVDPTFADVDLSTPSETAARSPSMAVAPPPPIGSMESLRDFLDRLEAAGRGLQFHRNTADQTIELRVPRAPYTAEERAEYRSHVEAHTATGIARVLEHRDALRRGGPPSAPVGACPGVARTAPPIHSNGRLKSELRRRAGAVTRGCDPARCSELADAMVAAFPDERPELSRLTYRGIADRVRRGERGQGALQDALDEAFRRRTRKPGAAFIDEIKRQWGRE
jgi:hypothetical protein